MWHFFHRIPLWGFTFMCKYSPLGSEFNFSIKFLCKAKLAVHSIFVIFAHLHYGFSQPSTGTFVFLPIDSLQNRKKIRFNFVDCIYIFPRKSVVVVSYFI